MLNEFINDLNKEISFQSELDFIEFILLFFKNRLHSNAIFINISKVAYFLDSDNTIIEIPITSDDFKNIHKNSNNPISELENIPFPFIFKTIENAIIKIDYNTLGMLIHENVECSDFNNILNCIARELAIIKNNVKKDETLHRYQILTEFSDDMIVILEGFKIIYANKTTYQKHNASYVDIINKPMIKFIHPEDIHKIIWLIKNINDSRDIPKDYPFRLLYNDKITYVHSNSKLIKSHNKKTLLVYMKDVTEKTLLEEKMKFITDEKNKIEKISKSLEKFASIGQLTAGVIHEINQPLHSIKTIIDSINYLDKKGAALTYDEVLSDLSKVGIRIDRVSEIMNSMRNLMDVKSSVELSSIDINREILKVIAFKSKELTRSKVQVHHDFLQKTLFVNFSKIQFQQVIINLIDNSITAMKKVKTPKNDTYIRTLTITTTIIEDNVIIELKDNGPGIFEGHEETIFKPFYTTNANKSNSGLGLFIIRQILSCYNATIHCKNTPTGGASFTIEIVN